MTDCALGLLNERDFRKIVRILGVALALEGDYLAKKREVMNSLCKLIQADAWTWSSIEYRSDPNATTPSQVLSLQAGFDQRSLAKWAVAIEHPDFATFTLEILRTAQASGKGVTRKSADFFDLCPAVPAADSGPQAEWRAADIDSFLLSAWPLSAGIFSVIGLYRHIGQPLFETREWQLAHMVFLEVPWLHREESPPTVTQSDTPLHPRHRTVLNLLVQGWNRKLIAAELGLATHTVHGYVKHIYRHFKVHSQAELISRFTRGETWEFRSP